MHTVCHRPRRRHGRQSPFTGNSSKNRLYQVISQRREPLSRAHCGQPTQGDSPRIRSKIRGADRRDYNDQLPIRAIS